MLVYKKYRIRTDASQWKTLNLKNTEQKNDDFSWKTLI